MDECTSGDIIELKQDLYNELIPYQLVNNDIAPEVSKMVGTERPHLICNPDYREIFGQSPQIPLRPLAPEEKTA